MQMPGRGRGEGDLAASAFLPEGHEYRVIFMQRRSPLASQEVMLHYRGYR